MEQDDRTLAELNERRQALADRLAAIRRDIASGLDADSEERAVQLENADVLDEIARVTTEELEKLDIRIAALRGGNGP